jgi:hypothetical protein
MLIEADEALTTTYLPQKTLKRIPARLNLYSHAV